MNFADFRLAPALLAALSASACHTTPASDWTVIESAASLPPGSTDLTAAQCKAICGAIAPAKCHVVDLDWAEWGTVRNEAAGAAQERAVVCDYHQPAEIGVKLVPTPFGRVPAALTGALPLEGVRTEGDYFLAVARAEAASVGAFRELERQLAALGAPSKFLRAAGRAARDEATHATLALELARHFGSSAGAERRQARPFVARRVRRPAWRPASAARLALENAVAGCAAESFGVWLHAFQARAAENPKVRRFAERIAREESRHAAFAFQLFDWLGQVISASEQAIVGQALREHWRRMPEVLRPPLEFRARLGLPSEAEAHAFAGLIAD